MPALIFRAYDQLSSLHPNSHLYLLTHDKEMWRLGIQVCLKRFSIWESPNPLCRLCVSVVELLMRVYRHRADRRRTEKRIVLACFQTEGLPFAIIAGYDRYFSGRLGGLV
jgi:hypothetical protein